MLERGTLWVGVTNETMVPSSTETTNCHSQTAVNQSAASTTITYTTNGPVAPTSVISGVCQSLILPVQSAANTPVTMPTSVTPICRPIQPHCHQQMNQWTSELVSSFNLTVHLNWLKAPGVLSWKTMKVPLKRNVGYLYGIQERCHQRLPNIFFGQAPLNVNKRSK